MGKKPLITIITATFNVEEVIERSILSVINQEYENIEYIVIDGGSTDGTVEILKKYSHRISYWISEKDAGIYDAWNKGLSRSTGDWISFLGADDLYLPGALSNFVNYIDKLKDPSIEFISSKINLINQNGNIMRTVGKPWNWDTFRVYMNVSHVGALHSKSLFDIHGLYNLDYKIIADYELLLRRGKNLKADFLDIVTVNMQIGGVSNQSNLSFNEVKRAKIFNKARTPIMAYLDYLIANIKFSIRKIIIPFY